MDCGEASNVRGDVVEPQPNCSDTCTSTLAFGVKVARNGRNVLEDAFAAQLDIACVSPIQSAASPPAQHSGAAPLPCCGPEGNPLSFFGVYDGHGGDEAAQHCASRMHENFLDELRRVDSVSTESTDSHDSCASSQSPSCSFSSGCSGASYLSSRPVHDSGATACNGSDRLRLHWRHAAAERQEQHVRDALRRAYIRTDTELQGTEVGEVVGSTAVTAVVSNTAVYIAHCGDSRAVLCRKGRAIALTADHKPDRKDEADRVAASGGKVLFKGGSHRVMGLLAMSRAIGDHFLRPYVIPEPEVMSFQRSTEDELLLLASDGLWDTVNAQEAVQLALRSNARAKARGASKSAACRVAASVLTSSAIQRGSRDNITVLVVDLQQPDVTSRTAILATQCSDDGTSSSSSGRLSKLWGAGGGGEGVVPGGGTPAAAAAAGEALGPPRHSAPVHRRAQSTVTTAGAGGPTPCGEPAAGSASLRGVGGDISKARTQSFSSYELGRVQPPLAGAPQQHRQQPGQGQQRWRLMQQSLQEQPLGGR